MSFGDPSGGFTFTATPRRWPSYADLININDGEGKQRSYLATEVKYRVTRDLEMKNLIVPLAGDFAGTKTIRAVGQYLRDRDATVGTFYTSKLEQYMFEDGKVVRPD